MVPLGTNVKGNREVFEVTRYLSQGACLLRILYTRVVLVTVRRSVAARTTEDVRRVPVSGSRTL